MELNKKTFLRFINVKTKNEEKVCRNKRDSILIKTMMLIQILQKQEHVK